MNCRGEFLTEDEGTYNLHISLWRLKEFILKMYFFHKVDSHNIFILMPINRENEVFIAWFLSSPTAPPVLLSPF